MAIVRKIQISRIVLHTAHVQRKPVLERSFPGDRRLLPAQMPSYLTGDYLTPGSGMVVETHRLT